MATQQDQLVVKLRADIRDLTTKLQRSEQQVKATTSKMETSFSGLKAAIAPIGGMLAAAFGVAAMKGFVKASNEQELAVNQLNATLKKEGIYSDILSKKMQDLASNLQKQAGAADELTMAGVALMENLGHLSAEQLPEATKAALGLAKVMGVNTRTAFMLMGRAASGSTTMFSRYGITLDASMSKQEKFAEIMRIGKSGMQLATAAVNSQAGQLEQLSMAWGDLKEKFGDLVKSSLVPVVQGLQKIVDWLNNTDAGSRKLILGISSLTVALAAGSPFIMALTGVIGLFKTLSIVIYTRAIPAVEAFLASIGVIGWIIGGVSLAIGGAIALFSDLSEETKTAESEMGRFGTTTKETQKNLQELIATWKPGLLQESLDTDTGDKRVNQENQVEQEITTSHLNWLQEREKTYNEFQVRKIDGAARTAEQLGFINNEMFTIERDTTIEHAKTLDQVFQESQARRVAAAEDSFAFIEGAYDQFWASLANKDMTGAERMKAIANSLQQATLRLLADQLKAFIITEAAKKAASKTTTLSIVQDNLTQTLSSISAAGASILGAIANGFKWLVGKLGVFGLGAGIALGAAIIAAFGSFKSALGFEQGGILPAGKAGIFEGTHDEIVAPKRTFVEEFRRLVPEILGNNQRITNSQVNTRTINFHINALDGADVETAVRDRIIPLLQNEHEMGVAF